MRSAPDRVAAEKALARRAYLRGLAEAGLKAGEHSPLRLYVGGIDDDESPSVLGFYSFLEHGSDPVFRKSAQRELARLRSKG